MLSNKYCISYTVFGCYLLQFCSHDVLWLIQRTLLFLLHDGAGGHWFGGRWEVDILSLLSGDCAQMNWVGKLYREYVSLPHSFVRESLDSLMVWQVLPPQWTVMVPCSLCVHTATSQAIRQLQRWHDVWKFKHIAAPSHLLVGTSSLIICIF